MKGEEEWFSPFDALSHCPSPFLARPLLNPCALLYSTVP